MKLTCNDFVERTITDRQKRAIKFIEDVLEIEFTGTTFEEAFEFIGANLKNAQFCVNIERQIGLIGVSMFHSQHNKRKGLDETYVDNRDTLAELQFKSDLIHGKKPINALIDLQENLILEADKED